MDSMLYDDGNIACDEADLIVRRYYPWGSKTIPYASIRSVTRRPLSPVRGKWRLFGSGDFRHWWNFDARRPRKSLALDLDVGGHVHPTITPDDPDAVDRILTEHRRD
jgi:hypothetical protein